MHVGETKGQANSSDPEASPCCASMPTAAVFDEEEGNYARLAD
jgi:hypothetical protein